MKTRLSKLMFLLIALPIIFFGCKKSEVMDNPSSDPAKDELKTSIVYCGVPMNATLREYWATSSPSYGDVIVGNSTTKLYVTINLTGNWVLYKSINFVYSGADLFVGSEASLLAMDPGTYINPDGTGHFYFWKFPYQYDPVSLNEQTYTFEIDRSLITESCPYVVLGVNIKDTVTNEIKFVSAKSNLKCMGFWLKYCFQTCNSGTAYAKSETTSTCFLNLPAPGPNSNNWGWSNYIPAPAAGSSVTFHWPLYAGAGQCSLANAVLTGYVDGTYDGSNVTLTYNMVGGSHINSTALWVGNDYLPLKKGKYNTAPGQFPYQHPNLGGLSTDTYGPIPITGNIYIAAHADATW